MDKKRNKALHLNTLIDDYGVLARCLSPLVKDELIERHSDYRPLPLKVMTTELSPRSGISNPDSWISKNGFIEYFGKLRVRNILYLDDILLDLILLLNRFPFLRLCITIFDDNQPVLGIDTSQGIKIIKKEDCVKMVENYSLNANNTLSGESRSFSELFSDAEIVKEPLDIDEIANMIGIRGCDLRK